MMEGLNENNGGKESCFETSSASKGKVTSDQEASWNVLAVRNKVTDRCLWSACKAMTAGFILILVGAGMATLGFYSDHLSKVEETKGNTTVWVKNNSKDTHFGILTYLGPVIMGIGGFTVVAACVMTFEARDTAAKIVPIWFKRTRIHVVSGGSGSTPSGRSSKASWERFLSHQKSTEDAGDNRTAVTEALVNFSKYLQNSVDTNKISRNNLTVVNQQIGIRKCPSEPNLPKTLRDSNGNNLPETLTVFETSTPQPSQRGPYSDGQKIITGISKPQLLSVAPDTYRQAVSMDCPRSNRYDEGEDTLIDMTVSKSSLEQTSTSKIQTVPFQTSCATSSSGSMSVDIYLPQGAVTVKIHDDMKETTHYKHLPTKIEDVNDCRGVAIREKMDIPSFEIKDELPISDLDDSVFINQEHFVSKTQTASDSNVPYLQFYSNFGKNNSSIEENMQFPTNNFSTTYHDIVPHFENKSESLEVTTPEEISLSPSQRTNFSFECSETSTRGYSLDSCISNPFSSEFGQSSLSKADTSFYNVSSFDSKSSSQDINSPLIFCQSPRCCDSDLNPSTVVPSTSTISLASNQAVKESEILRRTISSPSESERYFEPAVLKSGLNYKAGKVSPRKYNSLESDQTKSSKKGLHKSRSPKRQPLSLEGCSAKLTTDASFPTPLSPRFLSPKPLSPTSLTFSPRKSRSESLPERRHAPSLKRFPLLRQGALDSMVEEKGSVHRLDRSQTQIYFKDP